MKHNGERIYKKKAPVKCQTDRPEVWMMMHWSSGEDSLWIDLTLVTAVVVTTDKVFD